MSRSSKKKNEPVYQTEEQLKAEILAKRDEQAKIDALKKPPPPRKVKAENFWYHYKWHTLTGVVALCLIVFFLKDTVLKTDPDATIILLTSRYVSTEAVESLQAALAEAAGDRNGDGKVYAAVDSIQFSPTTVAAENTEETTDGSQTPNEAFAGNGEAEYASTIKLTTVVVAGLDPIYLVDDELYGHLMRMATGDSEEPQSLFIPLPEIPGAVGDRLPFSETELSGTPGLEDLEDLTFCIRPSLKEKESHIAYYNYCMELLKALAE